MEKTPVRELIFYKIENSNGFYKVLKNIERDWNKETIVLSCFLEEREAEIFIRNYVDGLVEEEREKINQKAREKSRNICKMKTGMFTREEEVGDQGERNL